MSGRSQDADETFGVDVGPVDRDRCGVLVRISPEKRRQLKMTAIVRNTTVQQLLTEAIEIVLQSSDPGHAH
jgi:hypothetical protein